MEKEGKEKEEKGKKKKGRSRWTKERKKEYRNVRKVRARSGLLNYSEKCKEKRTSLVPVLLSGVLLVLLSLLFSGVVGFVFIFFVSGFLNAPFKALFGCLANNLGAATPIPLPAIPGIPVEHFFVCCGVATFPGTDEEEVLSLVLVAMLFKLETFEPLRLMGVVPVPGVLSVLGVCALRGVDPALTGLGLLFSLAGLRIPVLDKLLICTAFIGCSLLDLGTSLGLTNTGFEVTGLVSAVLVVSLDFWLGFLILDAFDGSFDFVNVSLRLNPGNEEVLDVDEFELERRLLPDLNPGAFRPLCDGTGICAIETIRTK